MRAQERSGRRACCYPSEQPLLVRTSAAAMDLPGHPESRRRRSILLKNDVRLALNPSRLYLANSHSTDSSTTTTTISSITGSSQDSESHITLPSSYIASDIASIHPISDIPPASTKRRIVLANFRGWSRNMARRTSPSGVPTAEISHGQTDMKMDENSGTITNKMTSMARRALKKLGLNSTGPDDARMGTTTSAGVPAKPLGLGDIAGEFRTNGVLLGGDAARAAAAAENERAATALYLKAQARSTSDEKSGIDMDDFASQGGKIARPSSKAVANIDPITYLPSELFMHIFSFLDCNSIKTAEQVSRAWKNVASSPPVWREAFRNELAVPWSPYPDTAAGNKDLKGNDRDWKKTFKVWTQLQQRWKNGIVRPVCLEGHIDSVYCTYFDEDKIITASRDLSIRIWDARTYRCLKIIGGRVAAPSTITIGSFPQRSISATGVITIPLPMEMVVFEARYRDIAHRPFSGVWIRPPMQHKASILCMRLDDEILVTGSSDCTCIVWSIVDDYRPLRRLVGHTLGVLDLSFDAVRIVSGSKDATLGVWAREDGRLLKTLRGHRGPVNAVQMRGNLAVSTGGDALIKLWDLDQGLCFREFTDGQRGLACLQLSEDLRWVLTGGNDHIIRLWDVDAGECVRTYHGHGALVRALSLDSRCGRVVSGSYDQSVKVFDLASCALQLDFPRWTSGWLLSTKADYRRIVAASYDAKIFVMDFGACLKDIELLEGLGLSSATVKTTS